MFVVIINHLINLKVHYDYFVVTEPRKGFLAEAFPVHIRGVGGPGAPHVFTIRRRGDLGLSTQRSQ